MGQHGPAIEMTFKWRFAGVPMMTFNAGLVALSFVGDPEQYCLETLYFYDFSEGPDPLSSLWIRAYLICFLISLSTTVFWLSNNKMMFLLTLSCLEALPGYGRTKLLKH